MAAAAKGAATADEDPLALQASMKQMLMAEIAESKRLSKAAENSLLNGAESERTARVRAQLKAGKKRLQDLEEQQKQSIVEEEYKKDKKRRYRRPGKNERKKIVESR